jgi:hypothetical protein
MPTDSDEVAETFLCRLVLGFDDVRGVVAHRDLEEAVGRSGPTFEVILNDRTDELSMKLSKHDTCWIRRQN